MSEVYNDIKVPYPKEGIIRDAEVSNSIASEESVQLALNLNFDSLGSTTLRKGLTVYGDTPGSGVIVSLSSWAENSSSNRRLLIQSDDEMYSSNAGVSTLVRTMTSDNKARFKQFTNYTYMVNGNASLGGDPVQSFDGTTFGTTNVADLQKGDYIEAYEGRIWIADKAEDKLYYSDIVDPAGVITGGLEFISKISPQDGQSFTALKTYVRSMLVFKQNNIYRVYSSEAVDPYPAYFVGTYSQESIVEAKNGLYFHHSSGFYRFNDSGQPQEISRRISDIVASIQRVNYDNVFGWKSQDENQVYWHVGDVTINRIVYPDVVLRYTISTEIWTIYSYRKNITAAINFDTGVEIKPLVGTTDTVVAEMDNGKTDLGKPIYYDIISHWSGYTETMSKYKKASRVAYYHENAAGALLSMQVDEDFRSKWTPVGKLTEKVVTYISLPNDRKFNRARWRISGESSGDPLRLYGSDIISLADLGYREN